MAGWSIWLFYRYQGGHTGSGLGCGGGDGGSDDVIGGLVVGGADGFAPGIRVVGVDVFVLGEGQDLDQGLAEIQRQKADPSLPSG